VAQGIKAINDRRQLGSHRPHDGQAGAAGQPETWGLRLDPAVARCAPASRALPWVVEKA
jgi:hypothetical protein